MGLFDLGDDQPYNGLSDQTLDFIKRQEGFAPKASWDYKQWSGGYGSKASPGQVFTPETAQAALVRDATPVSQWLDSNVTSQLSPEQRTALTSFGYNIGVGGLQNLLPDINAGNWQRVAERLQSYNHAGGQVSPGLTNRRSQEAGLLTGNSQMANYPDATSSMFGVPLIPSALSQQTANAVPAPMANSQTAQYGNGPGDASLVPPLERYRQLAAAFSQAGINQPVHGWGDFVRGFSSLLSGNLYGSAYEKQQQDYNRALGTQIAGAAGDPQKALAIAAQSGNPQLQAAALQSAMSPKAVTQEITIQDPVLGSRTVRKNPLTGQLYELDGTPIGGQAQGVQGAGPNNGTSIPEDVHGQDFLKATNLNPSQIALLKGITSYSLPIEQFRRLQNNPNLMSMAERYDPTFDAKEYKARQDLITSFKSKHDADEIKSYNTLMGHISNLYNHIDELGNYGSSWVNGVRNTVRNQYDNDFQTAYGKISTDIDTAVAEYNRATTGKPITVDEAKRWHDMLSRDTAPATMKAVPQEMLSNVLSRMEATAQKYNKGFNLQPDDPRYKTGEGLLDPHPRELYNQVLRRSGQGAAGTPPQVSGAQITSQRPAGKSDAQLLQEAQAAIKANADPNAVNQQLAAWGVKQ